MRPDAPSPLSEMQISAKEEQVLRACVRVCVCVCVSVCVCICCVFTGVWIEVRYIILSHCAQILNSQTLPMHGIVREQQVAPWDRLHERGSRLSVLAVQVDID